ncbi:cation diffusion facilitator family transporter [Neisseria zalophi]|uniref:Cation-efflux pump FieF n=1 Tax=Neisseria zalophi TaxID=640030 RepID=A0A5J6PW22_9NEIS|nr:cation diffusion facilitator family transporter [Neisseria zalophi]QEY26454.1 cation diffusion facilitator family transporter [Neisseria zalophi]
MALSRQKWLTMATYASTLTAVFLVLLKAAAWLLSGSVSILASFADSLIDLAASALNLIAVRVALKPADANHTFGHGKAEGLSALAQSAFIGGSAVFLLLNAVHRLINPEQVQYTGWGIGVMLISVAVTLALVTFQRYVLRQTVSQAVEADRLHYLSDILSNAVVLAALVMAAYGWHTADAWLALGLAVWMFKNAADIGKGAVNTLMDKTLSAETLNAIRQAALSVNAVAGVHNLKTRQAGNTVFVQLHISMDGAMSLETSHQAAKSVEDKIKALFEEADVIVHTDPVHTTL